MSKLVGTSILSSYDWLNNYVKNLETPTSYANCIPDFNEISMDQKIIFQNNGVAVTKIKKHTAELNLLFF